MLQRLPSRGVLVDESPANMGFPVGTWDGRHLVPWVHIQLLNTLLNALWRSVHGASGG